MCGIIGIASNKSVTANIIQSLKKLEYRGYDSSGIATIVDGDIDEKKCAGRVENLEKILFKSPLNGFLGIGHVRWATHGIPSLVNAKDLSLTFLLKVEPAPTTAFFPILIGAIKDVLDPINAPSKILVLFFFLPS